MIEALVGIGAVAVAAIALAIWALHRVARIESLLLDIAKLQAKEQRRRRCGAKQVKELIGSVNAEVADGADFNARPGDAYRPHGGPSSPPSNPPNQGCGGHK